MTTFPKVFCEKKSNKIEDLTHKCPLVINLHCSSVRLEGVSFCSPSEWAMSIRYILHCAFAQLASLHPGGGRGEGGKNKVADACFT